MEDNWQAMRPPAKPLAGASVLIQLDPSDDVAVVARDVGAGESLGELVAVDDVAKGHKIAVRAVAAGDPVHKYAQLIGYALTDIAVGQHVHDHNLEFRQTNPDYRIGAAVRTTEFVDAAARATFRGYKRANGKVGTRNYLGIISTVNCSATCCRRIAAHFDSARLQEYPNVDGVVAFIHGTGCGMAGDGEGMANLQRVTQGYVTHPNLAGVLIVGLGCEQNQLDELAKLDGVGRSDRLKTMNIQSVGGLSKTVEMGIKQVEQMLPAANEFTREQCSVEHLTVALQCGGSDGWSGVTANPALGYAADKLIAHGGSAVLAETSEVYGAEHLLTARSSSEAVANDLIERIKWWEDYVARNKGTMDNNPSPGNKRGGLSTILEKSLGAVAKAGTTNLNSVLHYAQTATVPGLAMMDSPGYDPASVTGQIASGCNLVAFTTGRGSAFGSKPAPTLKICTNSDTFRRMPDDMDINAGTIVDQGVPVAEVGEEIFTRLIELASGVASKSEQQDLGDHEFVPWQIGATM